MKKLNYALLALSTCAIQAGYAAPFVVKHIQITGLQRVSQSTVMDYLPVKVGDTINDKNTGKIINTLYKTGFFQDIKLERQGDTLFIQVSERPTIGSIKITGNSSLPTDKLNEVLKQVGLSEGLVFDNAVFERVKQGLLNEYYNLGHYNARIDVSIVQQTRNRVDVKVDISEGRIAKIRQIEFIGNHVFKSSTLLKELTITTPGIFTFFTRKDQYTEDKLVSSLSALTKYYKDRGYVRFKVDSAQIQLTQDRNEVYVIIRVHEGEQYTYSGYKLIGNFPVPEEELRKLVTLKPGQVFSEQAAQNVNNAIAETLGNKGYAFANISPQTDINDKTKQVFVTFYVNPGKRVYVRKINITGNTKTADIVLRRVIKQPEGGVASTGQIKESSRQLRLYPFINDVNVNTIPVSGIDNQVDLNYKVTEGNAAQATAGVGYGTNGFIFNAGFQQPNFMGSGNSVGFSFTGGQYAQIYSFNYYNPYFTESGIGRGYSLYYRKITPDNLGLSNYTTTGIGGSLSYSIPFTENSSIQTGFSYDNTVILLPDPSITAQELSQFTDKYGKHFSTGLVNIGWNYLTYDRAIFPTKGLQQLISSTVGFPLGSNPLYYYKLNYSIKLYYPIYNDFIFTSRGGIGYGDGYASTTDGLPFFQNYYAGGIGSAAAVRGYETSTLGPKDSRNNPLGGNFMVAGGFGIVLPGWFARDSLRTTVFMDAGNVYNTKNNPLQDQPTAYGQSKHAGPIRLSTGVEVEWRSPIGPLVFSLAKPLNSQPEDRTEPFQFTISTGF